MTDTKQRQLAKEKRELFLKAVNAFIISVPVGSKTENLLTGGTKTTTITHNMDWILKTAKKVVDKAFQNYDNKTKTT